MSRSLLPPKNPWPSFFVAGTDTGVGKTLVSALMLCLLRLQGYNPAYFKPVQTGALRGSEGWSAPDVEFVARTAELQAAGCGYLFAEPCAPYLAAQKSKARISVPKLKNTLERLKARHAPVIAEGAGGLLVPLTRNTTVLDLIQELDLPVLLVARASLGTINHTLLSLEALSLRGINIMGVVLNRFPRHPTWAEAHNAQSIKRMSGVPWVETLPEVPGLNVDELKPGDFKALVADWDKDGLKLRALRRRAAGVKETTASLVRKDAGYVWHPFTQMRDYLREQPHPIVIASGKGAYLKDTEGRQYLDGVSSLWANVAGHNHPQINLAVMRQLHQVAHSTLLGLANVPAVQLAAELAGIAPAGLRKVFYSDNGSCAVEIALKMAFQYWQHRGRPQKKAFISFHNAYHGDTLGSVSVGGIDTFHKIFEALLFKNHKLPSPYCYRCPVARVYPRCGIACLEPLEQLLATHSGHIAALIVEPLVQAAAGMLVYPREVLAGIAEKCRRYGVLLIVDEVATGFGRTGEMWACNHIGLKPDFLACAKGITGGYLPLAATLTTEEIYQAFLGEPQEGKTFYHGHTYTGNPLACAAALATLKLYAGERIMERLQPKIAGLRQGLEAFKALKHVGDVRQLGFMAGIELVKDKATKEPYTPDTFMGRKVILQARAKGVILRPLGDVLVLMPPLVITPAELKTLLAKTYQSVIEVTENAL